MARSGAKRRSGRIWWWIIGGLAAAGYLAVLLGATAAAFTAARYLRPVLASPEFRQVVHAAQHPITEADLPRLLPGIPIYPGAKLDPRFRGQTMSSLLQGEVRLHLIAPASASEVRAFYGSHMKGWASRPGVSDESILLFERGSTQCWISLMPRLPLGLGGGGTGYAIHYVENEGGR